MTLERSDARPRLPPPRPALEPPASPLRRRTPARLVGLPATLPGLLLVSAAIAGLSFLVTPNSIGYDPYSWLIWGRQAAHLHLDTSGAASSMKALPVLITTALAWVGGLSPLVWLFLARVGAVFAVVLAVRVGRRLGGWGAGVVAGLGLLTSLQLLSYLALMGMSEPMAAAAALLVVDAALQRRTRATFGWLLVLGLLRVEAWPFAAGYGLWLLVRRRPGWRHLVVPAGLLAMPLVWLGLDRIGSGHWLRSVGAASLQSLGGPLLSSQPGLATVTEAWHVLLVPFTVAFLVGTAAGVVGWVRARRLSPPPLCWLALAALAWLAVVAVMAQLRIATGASRYLLPGVALASVVAGVAVARAARLVAGRGAGSGRGRLATAAAFSAFALTCVPQLPGLAAAISGGLGNARQIADLSAALPRAVALAGGRAAILGCGPVATGPYQVPVVAWQLGMPMSSVLDFAGSSGTVLVVTGQPTSVAAAERAGYRLLGRAGPPAGQWVVLSTCSAGGRTSSGSAGRSAT